MIALTQIVCSVVSVLTDGGRAKRYLVCMFKEARSMCRLVCLVLTNGESVLAGCDSSIRDRLGDARGRADALVALTSDDAVDLLPVSEIAEVVPFKPGMPVPRAARLYHFATV